jgi:hypothetical protein
MKKVRTKDLLKDKKYGNIFKLVEKYGGGLEKWEKMNLKIEQQMRENR